MERKHLEKHLDIIQQNINRMASNSFMIKGWLIAIISASFVFVSKEYSYVVSLALIILTIGFSLLDVFYLQTENKFRELYNIVISDPEQNIIKDLEINIKHERIRANKKTHYINCFLSISIVVPYLFIIFYNILLFILIKT